MSTKDYLAKQFSLEGKVAVVVGGTGVLGGAIARGLGAAGAKVLVVGRNQERGQARVYNIQKAGGVAKFAQADVTKKEELEKLCEDVTKGWGRIDILVNGAGGNDPAATLMGDLTFSGIEREAWDKVFNLNLIGGALYPCQVFGGVMVEQKSGCIINIASMSGSLPLSRVVAYSAAKAAVINLTKFLAREWAPYQVRVNSVSPGFFPAEQNKHLLYNDDGSYTERGEQIINHTMLNRFGEAKELVGTLLWLASDSASSFVTGADIPVDGGFSGMTI